MSESKDIFVLKKKDYREDEQEFVEIPVTENVTVDALNEYFGEWSVGHELVGCIIYKCTPMYIIKSEIKLEVKLNDIP